MTSDIANNESNWVPAGFWIRAVAHLIDSLITILIAAIPIVLIALLQDGIRKRKPGMIFWQKLSVSGLNSVEYITNS